MLPREKNRHQMEKTQLLLLTHQMIWHSFQSKWVIFSVDGFLNSFHAHICRQLDESSLALNCAHCRTCLTNLLTEISLTFELRRESWPSFYSRLHSLIPSTQRCPFPFPSFTSSSIYFLPNALSVPDHIKKIYHSASKWKKWPFYLFVLMGEGESLYGGLDRSTVYTAQSVLQLQKLL